MSENAETTEKAAKKTTKKAAAKKAAPKKPAKKAAPVKQNVEAPAKKRGRPAGKKTGRPAGKKTGKRRGKKSKSFAYMLLTKGADGATITGNINGPFASEKDALDDASLMSDEKTETTVVIFREAKRGQVQRQTKFVVGR